MSNNTVILQSIITCPLCQHSKEETMPTDACQYFYECENCKIRLKPLQGDCCVFCSYGTVKCPPIQENKSCCSNN
ncbi:GDCCVxC domain-containing (seleno)protein [Pedobacter helvus]|uniref:GDCCVxC domain-containing (Seleno)protein n=1 Tax=Pedobacter helvus TaxID=2563444 RepID=A0ABW9JPB0_9SPHI|nr:GDCCVxC domain-containing (seleno)protein [Pedobacter ureilyticus]